MQIVGWTVREDIETLSDHCYITFKYMDRSADDLPRGNSHSAFLAWKRRNMDVDRFWTTLLALETQRARASEARENEDNEEGIDETVDRLINMITKASDVVMPRRLALKLPQRTLSRNRIKENI